MLQDLDEIKSLVRGLRNEVADLKGELVNLRTEIVDKLMKSPVKRKPSMSSEVKKKYFASYEKRWGIKPTWSVKQNSLAKKLIETVGLEEALLLAAAYPFYNDPWHIKKKHPFGDLVSSLDKVRVELADKTTALQDRVMSKKLDHTVKEIIDREVVELEQHTRKVLEEASKGCKVCDFSGWLVGEDGAAPCGCAKGKMISYE